MTTSFRSTLQRMVAESDPAERARLSEVFASQIEVALDSQGDGMQIALWSVEEAFGKKIDHIHEQLGNSNTLQSAVLEAISGLRTDVQHSAAESAARLGKLESRMDASEDDRADLRSRLDRIEQILAERPGQRAADHQALLAAIRNSGHGDGD